MKDRLKQARKQLGLKQRDVAERLNVSIAAYGAWETGRDPMPEARAYQFCKEYGVSQEWLRTGDGEMFEPEVLPKSTEELFKDTALAMFRQLSPRAQEALIAAMQDCSKEAVEKRRNLSDKQEG